MVANDDESVWDQQRKATNDEVQRSIERARLRRAEEERKLSEHRQAVCAEKLRLLNLKKAQEQQQQQQQQRDESSTIAEASPNKTAQLQEQQHTHEYENR